MIILFLLLKNDLTYACFFYSSCFHWMFVPKEEVFSFCLHYHCIKILNQISKICLKFKIILDQKSLHLM